MKKRTLITALLVLVGITGINRPAPAVGRLILKPAKEGAEEIVEYLFKRGTRETAEELAEYGGKSAVRELSERVVRETGEEGLEKMVKLSKRHGVKALRAVDNVDEVAPILRSLDNLGDDATGAALRRLSSSTGPALARMTKKFGQEALEAEIKHPGIGARLVKHFGDDGARLALKTTDDQAITFMRHADDIAKLPAGKRRGVKNLLFSQTDRMAKFIGRFVENNPGKTLFTAATTGIILTNADRVLGGEMQAVTGPDGKVQLKETKGLVGRTAEQGAKTAGNIISQILAYIMPVVVLALAVWFGIRLYGTLKITKMQEKAEQQHLAQDVQEPEKPEQDTLKT